MVKFNKEVKIITGELLTPYLAEGKTIYCWTRSGETVAKTVSDFNLLNTTVSETMVGGTSVVPVTPVYGTLPVSEVETSIPTVVEDAIVVMPEVITKVAEVVSPDETEDEKVTYVHVAPAIDDYLGDGEMQAGGVEVVPADEVEGRTEFIPAIEDDDYI